MEACGGCTRNLKLLGCIANFVMSMLVISRFDCSAVYEQDMKAMFPVVVARVDSMWTFMLSGVLPSVAFPSVSCSEMANKRC